jgi:hypothetical protein
MAKIKVMMSFIDIHTKNTHPVGEVFEASEERISEIKSVNPDLIQVIPESVVEAPKRKRKKVGEE